MGGYNGGSMRPIRLVASSALVSLAAVLAAALPAVAQDAPHGSFAAEAAVKVRASIPAPVEPEEGKPGPHLDFEWKGDLVMAGENAGTVSISVGVGEWHDQPVWLVTESIVDDWGGSKRSTEASYWLARDLTLLKGEWVRVSAERAVRLDFQRDGDGYKVQSETTEASAPDAPPAKAERRLAAPPGATFGRGALLLFLRHAPAKSADYELPLAPIKAAIPAGNEHEALIPETTAAVAVTGASKYGSGAGARDAWLAIFRHGDPMRGAVEECEIYLEPKGRALLGIDFRRPFGVKFVPKGAAGARVEYADDQPAKTWRACFLKFGHGYHLAVPRWIDAAIHWPTMHAHELKEDASLKDQTVDDRRKAWIEEFLKRSKHRTRTDADGLLQATLATAEEKAGPDGTVILATHPEFGGNIFHFKAIDGVWYIVRIDQ